MEEQNNTGKSSVGGLDENVAALLSYVFGFVTGLIFFLLEKDSRFVKFHAMQSILTSVVIFLLSIILGFIPILGWILLMILPLGTIALAIILMIKAYKNEWFKLPIIGDIAEKQAKI
ncbi:UNVERIFIED_CONTAM: putative membrane protein [Acetivibrio alkalicellulosi]